MRAGRRIRYCLFPSLPAGSPFHRVAEGVQETAMLTPTLTDPRAWRADTIDDQERWYYPLSERALSALDRSVRDSRGRPITELQASEELRHACAEDMAPVLAALETGRGFAIITAGQPGHYAPNDLQAAYWLVGQLLGRPMEQN